MQRKFVNPQGTFNETIGPLTNISVLVFGGVAMLVLGLWAHAFIWFLLAIIAAFFGGFAGAAIAAGMLSILYARIVDDLIAEKYLRKGWREVTGSYSHDQSSSAPGVEVPRLKNCPYCAEEIKFEAIKCKHCGSNLNS